MALAVVFIAYIASKNIAKFNFKILNTWVRGEIGVEIEA